MSSGSFYVTLSIAHGVTRLSNNYKNSRPPLLPTLPCPTVDDNFMKPLQSTPTGAHILEGSTFAIFCLVSCSAPSREVTLDPSFEPGEISLMTTLTQHCPSPTWLGPCPCSPHHLKKRLQTILSQTAWSQMPTKGRSPVGRPYCGLLSRTYW